jgi:membrane protein implicated in regulation of membrane protease activity
MPDFLNNWWENLNFELQMFYGIAIISLVALFFQVILSVVFGMEHGADVADVGDHDSGMGIFSVRGVTAFFTGFGWTGVVCTKQGLGLPVAITLALVVGGALMITIFLMMRSFMRLQSNGNLDYGNAVGQLGTVYVTVPPVQRAGGQVETMIQGRLVTTEALQKGSQPLQPGTKVKVVERIGSSTLIVESLD